MIEFITDKPNSLLKSFQDAILKGRVATWEEDSDGDFGHLARQWKGRGYLSPLVDPHQSLQFYYVSVEGEPNSREVYAYLHSKILDTFISHFSDAFTSASATSNPVEGEGEV